MGFATANEIDLQGIVRATRLAAIRALHQFSLSPQYLLTDFRLELPQLEISQTSLVKGDARCLSIACASILAKTEQAPAASGGFALPRAVPRRLSVMR